MEQKHTPGPWRVEKGEGEVNGDHSWAMVDSNGNEIFSCHWVAYEGGGSPPSDADADLIARAPELLQQVEALQSNVEAQVNIEIELREQVSALTKENELLKGWQESATTVLNRWYKVSEFLTDKNLVGLGEDYSIKCLEVLKALTEQVEKLKIESSKFAFECDRAKEDRNKAERESLRLRDREQQLVEALRELYNGTITMKLKNQIESLLNNQPDEK